jgi:hypothetical protein
MRMRGLYILLTAAGFLVCAWLGCFLKPPPATGDVSLIFLGFTNHPGSSMVSKRLYVVGNGRGLHALFAVTNITPKQYVSFGIAAVETQGAEGWKVEGVASDQPELGKGFSPGYGYHYAVPWPATVKADTPWRMSLWVKRERRLFSFSIHHHGFGRGLFRPYGRHTVTSEAVTPLRRDAAESRADLLKTQTQPSTDGSQPLRSETP